MIYESKEVFLSKFSTAFFAFLTNFFFSYLPKLVQPIRCAYTDHVTWSELLRKTFYPSTSTRNTFYTSPRFLRWPNVNFLYLLIVDFTSALRKSYDITYHMTSKLSVNIVYFFANFVLLHSFLHVGQG